MFQLRVNPDREPIVKGRGTTAGNHDYWLFTNDNDVRLWSICVYEESVIKTITGQPVSPVKTKPVSPVKTFTGQPVKTKPVSAVKTLTGQAVKTNSANICSVPTNKQRQYLQCANQQTVPTIMTENMKD